MAEVAWSECLPENRDECPTDYKMPSESMTPTILAGDRFFVDAQRYNTHWPDLGDVVVFFLKGNKAKYIKRVVGLPGDRIRMQNGILSINGVSVPKQRIADFVDKQGPGLGRPVPQYIETLPNGASYNVLDEYADGAADNTKEYIIPPNNYLMMGDNRDNSLDSRFEENAPGGGAGYVPRENVIARATSVWFSWKFARIGKKIE